LTVVFDMVIAVTAGVLLSSVLFMRRMATTPRVTSAASACPGRCRRGWWSTTWWGRSSSAPPSARWAPSARSTPRWQVIIFRMEQLLTVDVTGLVALEGVLEELERHGIKSVLVGLRRPAREMFERAGLTPVEGKLAFCDDMESAFRLLGARLHHLRRTDIGPVAGGRAAQAQEVQVEAAGHRE